MSSRRAAPPSSTSSGGRPDDVAPGAPVISPAGSSLTSIAAKPASKQDKPRKPPAPIRPSASLILLSTLPAGEKTADGYDYRIVMVRRNDKSSFKNATVFAGGNLDKADGAVTWPSLMASRRCAVRECFEETGILVSAGETEDVFAKGTGERRAWREKVHSRAEAWEELVREKGVKIDYENTLVHYHNWITPTILPKRYDTHFFLAALPRTLTANARHDASETLALTHYTPTEAIDAHSKDEIVLFVPQLYILHDLAHLKSWREVMQQRRSGGSTPEEQVLGDGRGWLPMMQPKLGCSILPGDNAYPGHPTNPHALNRSYVKMGPDGLKPLRIVRKGVKGLHDFDSNPAGPNHEPAKL
ncbi:hypothetical protein PYCC9005_005167 [Savitreella phatthalungensis]